MRKRLVLIIITVLTLGSTGSLLAASNSIVSELEKQGEFSTLLSLLDLAGLKETLAYNGPFTLLAPTDDAFAKLDPALVEFLLDNPDVLSTILAYHVVEGSKYSSNLLYQTTAETLNGNSVLALYGNGGVSINNSVVLRANVLAENGLIHVIDTVLVPPDSIQSVESILDVLRLDGRFTTLLAALEATKLDEALRASKDITLFAPTDEAFAALGEEAINGLLAAPETLANILLYHVAPGRYRSLTLAFFSNQVRTLQGGKLNVKYSGGLRINGIEVVNANLASPGGIIHVLSDVLIPQD